jgi:hypothetical protein
MLSALVILAVPAWAQRGQGLGRQRAIAQGTCLIDAVPKQELDSTEAAGMAYMREEEKLARDVYAKLYAKWGARIFANISGSEQRHFDELKLLLDRYGLADPAANSAAGIFQNADLQVLYSDLIAQGETSLAAALRVGAQIEDLDIHDLDKALAATDNDDLRIVYRNLRWGSENHIRAYVGRLKSMGENYTAQYISEAALTEILASSNAAGRGFGGRGNGWRAR